jgi:flagellar basal-body rod protein FlgC
VNVAYLGSMELSGGALRVLRRRMEIAAQNLAHAQTTRTASGEPYRRQVVRVETRPLALPGSAGLVRVGIPLSRTRPGHLGPVLVRLPAAEAGELPGVAVAEVADDPSPFVEVYDPGHPDADERGIVRYPNVDPAREMVELILAQRAYEANLAALAAARQIQEATLQMGRTF